jgi:WD40 repeat protein
MISSGYDDMIIVWDLETGSILKRIWLKGLDTLINSLAVQNNFVIAGGLDSKVRQIDLVSGRVVRTIGNHSHQIALNFLSIGWLCL